MYILESNMHLTLTGIQSNDGSWLGQCLLLRGDFLQNRILGAQNQSDARIRN